MKSRFFITAATLLSLQWPAQAVVNGVVPSMAAGAPPIVNPFTGQATDIWKFVGHFGGCSGFQITREWVIQAGHCALNLNDSTTFSGHLGTSTVKGTDCKLYGVWGGDDFQLCRLSNPENMTPVSSYPAMVAMPKSWRDDLHFGSKYGSVMGYGHATAGDGLAFTTLDGYPFGLDPAAPLLTPFPYTSGGDSGGALYWFPPGSATGYIVGDFSSGSWMANSPFYFREDLLADIKQQILARGDVPPNMPGIANVFTPPTDNPAPELAAPPVLGRTADGNGVIMSWATPQATPAISNFKVSIGRAGALESTFNVSPSAGLNQVILNLSASKDYALCARPVNALGAARPIDNFPSVDYPTVVALNCTTLDNRDNLSTITGFNLVRKQALSSQVSLTVGWSRVTSPADLAQKAFRVTQVVSYVSGPSRTSVSTLTSPLTTVVTPTGSKVCFTVSALAANLKYGPTSAPFCVMAN